MKPGIGFMTIKFWKLYSGSADEICQQELKNAVCITLKEKGSLMKNVIRTMGYARSSTSLVEAAEKGMKYGRKTGEIVQDEEKRFVLGK